MKARHIAVTAGFILASVIPAAWAADTEQVEMTVIDIAGHEVPVIKGGLYDRFRSNPPLSVIAEESPETDLSWFETLEKTRLDMGFDSYSPNFYYENSKVTAIYTADLNRLRELMPAEIMEQVQPLQVWPGRGLVALTAYAYHYCDNDPYNEISLAIVTNKPGSSNLGPISLIGQSLSDDFWGYVLKLPVDTQVANIRGIVGYNLPKWLTGIHYHENADSVTFEVIDHETGDVDFVLETAKLDRLSDKPSLVTNSFINIDQQGSLIYGHAVSRHLSYASTRREDAVNLTLSDGSFSRFIKSLDLGSMVRYEYVPDFQSALYAPEPLSSMLSGG